MPLHRMSQANLFGDVLLEDPVCENPSYQSNVSTDALGEFCLKTLDFSKRRKIFQ